MKKTIICFCVILLVLGAAGAGGAATIQVAGTAGLSSDTSMAVGQTFRLPENASLNSLTFTLQDSTNFIFNLYEWDAANAIVAGDALFTSGPMYQGSIFYEDFTVSFDDLVVSSGNDYLFFVSGTIGTTMVAEGNAYGDGMYVELDSLWDPGTPGAEWNTIPGQFGHYDMAFTLDYTGAASVPVPCAFLLLGSGIIAFAGLRKTGGYIQR